MLGLQATLDQNNVKEHIAEKQANNGENYILQVLIRPSLANQ